MYQGGVFGSVPDPSGLLLCIPFGGTKRYPGLYSTYGTKKEQSTNKAPYWAFDYWTGIDCAGFVQRIVMAAKGLKIPGVGCVNAKGNECGIRDLHERDTYNTHLDGGSIYSGEFFTDTNMTMYWANPDDEEAQAKLQKKLRKGDLVSYDGHVSTIYSDKPSCDNNSCTYEIIHAYGGNKYAKRDKVTKKKGKPDFSRKVIVTGEDISSTPTGFGRIKLWD